MHRIVIGPNNLFSDFYNFVAQISKWQKMNRLNNGIVYVCRPFRIQCVRKREFTHHHSSEDVKPIILYLDRKVTLFDRMVQHYNRMRCIRFELRFFFLRHMNSSSNWHDHGESYCKQLHTVLSVCVCVWVRFVWIIFSPPLFYIDAIGLIALLWPTLNSAAQPDLICRILISNSVSATLNNKNWFLMCLCVFFFFYLFLSSM